MEHRGEITHNMLLGQRLKAGATQQSDRKYITRLIDTKPVSIAHEEKERVITKC